MPINAPIQASIVNENRLISRIWTLFFTDVARSISGQVPVQLQSFTVATVPVAANYEGALIYVSNESGGKTVAFSDGTNWRRVQDRAIIS